MRHPLARLLVLCLAAAPAGVLVGCGNPAPPASFAFISASGHNQLDPQRMSWAHDIRIANALYEPLVRLNYQDMSIQPGVAKSWDLSRDKLTYTFHLRPNARWSNGDPVTAHDFVYAWRRAMLPDLAAGYSQLMFHIKGAHAFYKQRAKYLKQYAAIEKHAPAARGAAASDKPNLSSAPRSRARPPISRARSQRIRRVWSPASARAGRGSSVRGSAGRGASHDPAADAARAMWRLTLNKFHKMVGLRAPDARTLVVTLTHPTPYFLDLVGFATFMPVHAADLEQHRRFDLSTGMVRTDAGYWSDPNRLTTNGPYTLAGRSFRQWLHLEANPYYWNRGAVGSQTINELIVPNPQTALQTYHSPRAQAWLDVPSASNLAAKLLHQHSADVHAQPIAGTYFYDFNCSATLPGGRNNPLADARVRRALSMAIDRHALVDKVTRLHQPVARSFVPPGVMGDYHPPVKQGVTFHPAAARKLLARAGHAGGQGLGGLSILYNTGAGHKYLAEAVQAMWRKNLGVAVALEGVTTKVLGQRLKQHDFTIARASWIGDYPDPTTFLDKMKSHNGNNDCNWANPRYDALLEKAASQSGETRLNTLRRAEGVLLDDQPMALIFQYVSIYLIQPDVAGLKPNAWTRWNLARAAVRR